MSSDDDRGGANAPGGRAKRRLARWLDSDLVGVAATVYTAAVVAISIVVFSFAGPLAGFVVAVAVWIPMLVFAIRGLWRPAPALDLPESAQRAGHRVLVVANHGLEDPALCQEVCRRGERAATEAFILAPVTAGSRFQSLSDDVDRELEAAERRIDAAVKSLGAAGVSASGRADVGEPMDSLLDGLREFPANEVVMLPRRERGWESAGATAERVRAEAGIPVTEIDAAGGV
jgi:nucleotide-binding universal stress UspA family protein